MSPDKPRQRQMLDSMYSMIALVFIIVACVQLCDTATVVDVNRLIQYDISGVPFGSRLATLNHHAGSLHFTPGADLSRTVVIIPIRKHNITFVKGDLFQLYYSRKPFGGLLFLLPRIFNFEDRGATGSEDQVYDKGLMKTVLAELERLLIHANIPYPVYFAFENDDIGAVLADVKRNDATGQPATATSGGYKLVVSAPERELHLLSLQTFRRVLDPISLLDALGWLPGLKADGDPNQLPTIAIVASYDTFGTGNSYDTHQLQFWLRSFDQRLCESIDYAICLNSIGSWDNELWIHVSKPPENAYIKQIFEGFSNVAKELGLEVSLKHKKINISNPRVAWEHEQFSRLRITAATLSELSAAPKILESTGGLSDIRYFVNDTAIARSINLVAESIARHIYSHQGENIKVFADDSSLSVNPSYIRSWLDLLSRTPRVAPFLSKNDPFVMALKKELEDHAHEINVQIEVLDGMFTFYDSTKAKLNIYQVASVTFDLLLLRVLGSYLIVLFSFLIITTRGLDDLISLFRRPPSRKVKTA
ncbi:hypothetical protein P3X46_000020 [Hevea brasiliensis]|uniref:Nicalin n=1 Tax=Hevea brasiliensis TaxID=3981 RepID=A0ABQ9NA34_HEVBR|nr:hypothetical protein P3X46_000020 [Hevea brasiliensis]